MHQLQLFKNYAVVDQKTYDLNDYYDLRKGERTGKFVLIDRICVFKNGELHNLYGPSVIWYDGTREYFIEGKEYTEEEFNKISFAILNDLEVFL